MPCFLLPIAHVSHTYSCLCHALLPRLLTVILRTYILGPSSPLNPIDLVYTTVSSESAQVQWLIPDVAYTPENYTVVYGEFPSQLTSSSDVVLGSDDVRDVNQMYSATLLDLEPNTTYYYQVVASNSIGTNSSDVELLVTPLPSKYGGKG